jgi:hypothetical protein
MAVLKHCVNYLLINYFNMIITLYVVYVQFADILGKVPCWENHFCTPICPVNLSQTLRPSCQNLLLCFLRSETITKYILCIHVHLCIGIWNLMCTVTKFSLELAGTYENYLFLFNKLYLKSGLTCNTTWLLQSHGEKHKELPLCFTWYRATCTGI